MQFLSCMMCVSATCVAKDLCSDIVTRMLQVIVGRTWCTTTVTHTCWEVCPVYQQHEWQPLV